MGKLETLIARIPWRMMITVLGGVLVFNGGAYLLSVELPADSEEVTWVIKQGMGMVLVGGVVLIAAFVSR